MDGPAKDVPTDSGPAPNTAWLAVLGAVAIVVVAVAIVVLGADPGPRPPFLDRPRDADVPAAQRPEQGVVALAGSGSNLAVTRALVSQFETADGTRAVVYPSIGSGGGVRALLDGVVDVALVSRPLKERERALGLVAIPYARVPVIVAVHSDVPDEAIDTAGLVAIYAGHRGTWSDGSRITVLQRERGDSSHSAVARVVPGFAETNDDAYRDSRWRVLYHDDAMTDALDSTPGALGLFGQGAIPKGRSLRALRVDGVAPSLETVASGTYPFSKDLAFVTVGEPSGHAAELIEFTRSPQGAAILRQLGALPLLGKGTQ